MSETCANNYMYYHYSKTILLPPAEGGWDIEMALSVRPSVCPSVRPSVSPSVRPSVTLVRPESYLDTHLSDFDET